MKICHSGPASFHQPIIGYKYEIPCVLKLYKSNLQDYSSHLYCSFLSALAHRMMKQIYFIWVKKKIRCGWNFVTFSLSSFVRSLWRNNFGLTWNLFFSKTSSTFWHISRLASLRDGELRSNRRQPCSFLNWYMVDRIWQSGPSGVKSTKWRIWRQ